MKRTEFLKYLKANGCSFLREGGRHSMWKNHSNDKVTYIPRHNEIDNVLVKTICRQLHIPKPKKS